jgi:ABC-2 type transport system ATP-binding protein
MAMAIRFEGVSKSFRITRTKSLKDMLLGVAGHRERPVVFDAVRDLNLEVDEGESVALLGHNGSGKSTTLKMLAGTVGPSSGRIWARGRIAPLLELGAGFHPDLTGRENLFLNGAILGLERNQIRRLLDEIVAFAEVSEFLDTPVKFYSSGMAVRLGFAIAVHVEPEILLVDEVLAVGDEDFQKKCLNRMRQLQEAGKTIVLVTHSLRQAEEFCSRAVVLDHGEVTHDGNVADAAPAFAASSRS